MFYESNVRITVEIVKGGILVVAQHLQSPLLRTTKLIDFADCKAEVLDDLRQSVESYLARPPE